MNTPLDELATWNQLYDAWLSINERGVQARENVIRKHIACVHGVGAGPSLEELCAVQQFEAATAELQSELDRFLESLYGDRRLPLGGPAIAVPEHGGIARPEPFATSGIAAPEVRVANYPGIAKLTSSM